MKFYKLADFPSNIEHFISKGDLDAVNILYPLLYDLKSNVDGTDSSLNHKLQDNLEKSTHNHLDNLIKLRLFAQKVVKHLTESNSK